MTAEPARCWLCGTEGETDTVEVTGPADTCKVYMTGVARWLAPSTDGHDHSTVPPTPGELLAAGARAFDRIMAVWS